MILGPNIWGPHGWKFIHFVTLAYPIDNPDEETKKNYRHFFTLLQYVLPCKICANHYAENLEKLPLSDDVLSSRNALVRWAIDMHNIVNESKNKPIMKYEDAMKVIDTDEKCTDNIVYVKNNDNIYYLLLIVFSLIIIAVIYKKK
jgi:hypothetical protein